MRVYHHKTGELVEVPLYDEDGVLWPESWSALMRHRDTAR